MVTFMKHTPFWTEELLLYTLLCDFKFMSFLGFVNLNDIKNCKTSFFFFSVVKGDFNIFSADFLTLDPSSVTL